MVTARYILVCDDVRVEINGKFIIIGLYTPNILVPQLPFAFPSLTFVQAFHSDRPGKFQFRARLAHLESGKEIAQAMGLMEVGQPGMGLTILRFGNLQIDKVGAFNFSINVEGQSETIDHNFEILLQPRV